VTCMPALADKVLAVRQEINATEKGTSGYQQLYGIDDQEDEREHE
jgi:hypothetical protein